MMKMIEIFRNDKSEVPNWILEIYDNVTFIRQSFDGGFSFEKLFYIIEDASNVEYLIKDKQNPDEFRIGPLCFNANYIQSVIRVFNKKRLWFK